MSKIFPALLNLNKIHNFKKKELEMKARTHQQQVRVEVAAAKKFIQAREKQLVQVPMEKLPEIVDQLARERQENRRMK